jgi:hypothetical protein
LKQKVSIRSALVFLPGLVAALLSLWPMAQPALTMAGQSTGDTLTLPTKTPTPAATFTAAPSPSATPETMVWVARLASNTPGFTQGQGSIFRVNVAGLKDVALELRSDDQSIQGQSGTKPEYGPFAAEFAPVTEGWWTVSAPALGASVPVQADNYNLAVIEFVQIPASAATAEAQPTGAATPLAAEIWAGRLVEQTVGNTGPFARLLVRVVGKDAQPIRLSTISQELNTAFTGQKPDELGPNVVEFAGLTPGKYFIDAVGLNATVAVDLWPNTLTRVEFALQIPTPAPTPTATATSTPQPWPTFTAPPPTSTLPPTATPLPTQTIPPPAPPPPSATPVPPPTATPLSVPTPVTRWIGAIESRTPGLTGDGQISVRVPGIEGMAIRLTKTDAAQFDDLRCVTGQGQVGQDACRFEKLPPGWYNLAAEGLSIDLPLPLPRGESVQVVFDVDILPPGITGWRGRINEDSNHFLAQPRTESTVRVKVAGRAGQVVALHSVRLGSTRYCETVYNPVLGGMMCEFGQLGPGVYRVEALHTGAVYSLFVDGVGRAEVEFLPDATYATQSLNLAAPLIGQGGTPRISVATATPTIATPTPAPTPPLVAIVWPTPTVFVIVIPTATPTPAFAWQGRVVNRTVTGAGALGVRAAGLKDHPVIVRSGSWQSYPQMTGTKPELGDYATEFGGLAQGDYEIELVDLATFKVQLGSGEYLLVEFQYNVVPPSAGN